MCNWLKVTPSGYYSWLNRDVSQHTLDDKILSTKIIQIHRDSRGAYGRPRVYKALKKQGIKVGKKRVERLMQEHGLQGRVVKVTFRRPGRKLFTKNGSNLRLNQAGPTTINRVWVSDITYIKVGTVNRYLIVIMDLYSRRILSWRLFKTRTTHDTLTVLRRAVVERQPTEDLIFHTDREIEFTAYAFRDALLKYKMKPSVNRLGHCTDNAHMESYFHSLKAELIRGRSISRTRIFFCKERKKTACSRNPLAWR
jgi:transposase InsO family protein